MLLGGLFRSIALHAHHIQNHRMVNQAINGGHRGHGVFENAFPFAKDQIGTNHHRFALVALSQKGEEYLHFITIMLDIADIIENHAREFV